LPIANLVHQLEIDQGITLAICCSKLLVSSFSISWLLT